MYKSKIDASSLRKLLRSTIFKRSGFIDRSINVAVLRFVKICRRLHVSPSLIPKKIRGVYIHWTELMINQYISSRGLKIFHEIPSTLNIPKKFTSKIDYFGPHKLDDKEIEQFYSDGFIGPFDAVTSDDMDEIRTDFYSLVKTPHPQFGFVTSRDRHLSSKTVQNLLSRSEIVDRCAQLLGPNIVTWRSQFFDKQPGSPAVPWHQALTYLFEDYGTPVVQPPSYDDLFQLTVWVAVDKSTVENGCVHFIPGSHLKILPIEFGGNKSFGTAPSFLIEGIKKLELNAQPIELEPGQFVIFTERIIHGSKANRSVKPRMGLNMRVVRTDTKIYDGKNKHVALQSSEDIFDLKHWGVKVLRGTDEYGLNPLL